MYTTFSLFAMNILSRYHVDEYENIYDNKLTSLTIMTAYKTPVARRSAARAGALANVSPMCRYAPAARKKHCAAAAAPSAASVPVDINDEPVRFPEPMLML